MSIEFETPAARVIEQFSGKDKEQFRIPTNLPDLSFLRALSVQGRLFYQVAVATDNDVIPATGATFFCYQVVISNAGATARTIVISNNSQTRLSIRINAQTVLVIPFFDSLVGNSSKVFTVTPSGAATEITVLSWIENTSRIRDVTI